MLDFFNHLDSLNPGHSISSLHLHPLATPTSQNPINNLYIEPSPCNIFNLMLFFDNPLHWNASQYGRINLLLYFNFSVESYASYTRPDLQKFGFPQTSHFKIRKQNILLRTL